MPYKDKAKRKEAAKAAKERYKERRADIAVREALGIPPEGIPSKGIPQGTIDLIEARYRKRRDRIAW